MDAKERYTEVHDTYRKAMYNLFITDTNLYNEINIASVRLAEAAFEFGAEEAKKNMSSRQVWNPHSIHDVF